MKKIIAVLAVLVSVSSAHAADKAWNVAGLIGYGVGKNTFKGLTYGAEVNYHFMPSWTAGLYWSMTKNSDSAGNIGTDVTFMPIMLTANYLIADVQGLYVGPRVGIASQKTSFPTTSSQSTSDFALGAQAGYDYSIATDWSVGVEANWNLILASSSTSLFNFVVPVKFHF